MNGYPRATQLALEQSGCSDVVETLHGGLSDSGVYRVTYDGKSAVLKCQKDRRELAFLTELAPVVLGAVDWLPEVIDFGENESGNWLLIEYIPIEWPEQRRDTDPIALSILRDLHSTPLDSSEFDWDDSDWTHKQLNVAEDKLPKESFQLLQEIHAAYLSRKSMNLSVCSGDPNCPNWLLRANGQAVLIDWQITTIANRALDLAGWVSTFVDFDDMKVISKIYLGEQATDEEIRETARDIAIYFCRRCSMNFWRAETSHDPSLWRKGIEYAQQVLPSWIEKQVGDGELLNVR